MNVLVVCYSKFGNTWRLAETIARALQSIGTVRLVEVGTLTAEDFNGVQLLVMGSPTHNMNLPKALQPILAGLPRRVLRGCHVAAFDTSYKLSWWLTHFVAAKRLAKRLRRLGGKQIAGPETFHVTGREGPLYPGEMERAEAWAGRIGERLAGASSSGRSRYRPVVESS